MAVHAPYHLSRDGTIQYGFPDSSTPARSHPYRLDEPYNQHMMRNGTGHLIWQPPTFSLTFSGKMGFKDGSDAWDPAQPYRYWDGDRDSPAEITIIGNETYPTSFYTQNVPYWNSSGLGSMFKGVYLFRNTGVWYLQMLNSFGTVFALSCWSRTVNPDDGPVGAYTLHESVTGGASWAQIEDIASIEVLHDPPL